ncbi:unnamed protein product [Boreogadus saida]
MEEMKDISMAGLRSMFYMVTPNESSFQHVEEVPKYTSQASPFFITLILLELVVGWIKTGKPIASISDGITSIFAGIISRLPSLFMRGLELTTYIFVWNHFRMVVLPWDSPWTWWLAFLAVDFGYYWVHRSSHGKPPADHSPRARHGPALLTRRSPTLGVSSLWIGVSDLALLRALGLGLLYDVGLVQCEHH